MKLGVLGLFALAVSLAGCSGTQTIKGGATGAAGVPSDLSGDAGDPGGDGGDAAGGASAGAESGSGCRADADCRVGVCDSLRSICVECRSDATCGDGERCDDDGRCVNAMPCTAGTYSCAGQVLQKCSPSGSPEFFRQCAKTEFCDERRAQCEPQVCVPGAASCDGGQIRICNDTGSDYTPKQLCSLSQVCRAGQCLDIGCVPNTTFCSQGNVWTCGADGTTSTLSTHCPANQFCLEKDHAATCSPTACFPGDALCVGNFASSCEADGSGPKPGGDDCSKANQTCYSGECRDPLCTPGLKRCDGNKLYLCSDAGTAETQITDCGSNGTCDAATGACLPRICEPGTLSCDSTRVVTCNQAGTAWLQLGPDCAATHGLCSGGSCETIVCTPNASVCDGDNVATCNADGTGYASSISCGPSYRCTQYSSYYSAFCSTFFCQPSSAGCNGNVLTTCNADGTAWAAGGMDCSLIGDVCSGAQCKPTVCSAYGLFCMNGNVQACDSQGLSSFQYTTCSYGTYCKAQAGTVSCALTPCLPATDGCVAEKYGHCAADGLSVTSATDCTASSQICTPQGCATSEVESIGGANQVSSDSNYNLVGAVVGVQSTRKLAAIEMYLTLPASRTLTWAVYESTVTSGGQGYTLKFQKTSVGTGTGFQSSGDISFQLDAGKTYAIGVAVTEGTFVAYYDSAVTAPVFGFGSVSGGFLGQFAPTFNYAYFSLSNLYYERLTTTAP